MSEGSIAGRVPAYSLAIDAMGGDNAPDAVLDGIELSAERHPEARFLLLGDEAKLSGLLARRPRAARLLDSHFPDSGIAAEALARAVNRALETGVPLVDVAYLSVTSGEGF